MSRRDEILRELRLAPTWRLRTRSAVEPAPAAAGAPAADIAAPAGRVVPLRPAGDAGERLARIAALEWPVLAADIDACNACGLCRTRNRSVPGVGDPHARWLLVGEAPGAEEDARGEPFVGQAGRLLDNMLDAVGLTRSGTTPRSVYIANVLKCRPPGNRNPEPGEVAQCEPFLKRQIELINPKVVLVMGRFAAQSLLGTDASIASLRGKVHRIDVAGRSVAVVVTYHPAYLLRNLADKAKSWADLCLAREVVAAA